jgi:hypothetical protein
MEKVPQLTVEMVQLIPHAIELLQTGTETLKKAVEVLEWYIVIDPVTVLQSVGQVLLNTIGTLLQNLSVNASKSVFQLLDAMIQSCQANQG